MRYRLYKLLPVMVVLAALIVFIYFFTTGKTIEATNEFVHELYQMPAFTWYASSSAPNAINEQNKLVEENTLSWPEYLKKAFRDGTFEAMLKQLLAEDEALALQLLPDLISESSFYPSIMVLRDHFSQYQLTSALDRIEALRHAESLHQQTAVMLLKTEAKVEQLEDLINYLSQPDNSIISSLSAQEVGGQLTYAVGGGADSLSFFEKITNEELKNELMIGGAREWMREDPAAALEYLRTAPPNRNYDESIELYVAAHSVDNPAQTLEWSAKIVDPELSKQAIAVAAEIYHSQDSGAYYNWLSSQDSELKEYLLKEEAKKWVQEDAPPVATREDRQRFRDEDESLALPEMNENPETN